MPAREFIGGAEHHAHRVHEGAVVLVVAHAVPAVAVVLLVVAGVVEEQVEAGDRIEAHRGVAADAAGA
ncbi:MAG: hypothetical protein ACYTF3_12405, partial [Planctomycetota bacterium]